MEFKDGKLVNALSITTDGTLSVETENNGHICTDNSMHQTLEIGETVIGAWQDTLNYNNIIIGVSADQDSITDGLEVEWSHDGIAVDDKDVFTIMANTQKVFTFCPARRYVRLTYTNNGVIASNFDIQTIFKKGGIKPSSHRITDHIIGEDDAELTKSVLTGKYEDKFINIEASVGGAIKTALEDGQTSSRVEIEPLGSMKTVTPVRLAGTTFNNGSKDPNFWTETTTGSGVVSQAGQIVLSTGTTADSSAIYDSVRKARKVTGATNQFRAVGRLETEASINNVRRTGCYNADNGFFFQVDGETFGIGVRKNGIDTIIENGSFNGNAGETITLNTNLRKFVIEYTAVNARFFVDGILLHTLISNLDALTNTLDLPIRMENYNENGNTTEHSFQIRFATIMRLGTFLTNPTYRYINTNTTTVCKYGAGMLHRLIVADNVGDVILYDGTSTAGKLISELDTAQGSEPAYSVEFNVPFSDGLTIVTTRGIEVTVVYE